MSRALLIIAAIVGGVTLGMLTIPAEAATARSNSTVVQFVRQNPCPATGLNKMPCSGWRADHRLSLCAGGADTPENMQWQRYGDSLRKDREERALCSLIRRGVIPKTLTNDDICVLATHVNWPYTAAAICKD